MDVGKKLIAVSPIEFGGVHMQAEIPAEPVIADEAPAADPQGDGAISESAQPGVDGSSFASTPVNAPDTAPLTQFTVSADLPDGKDDQVTDFEPNSEMALVSAAGNSLLRNKTESDYAVNALATDQNGFTPDLPGSAFVLSNQGDDSALFSSDLTYLISGSTPDSCFPALILGNVASENSTFSSFAFNIPNTINGITADRNNTNTDGYTNAFATLPATSADGAIIGGNSSSIVAGTSQYLVSSGNGPWSGANGETFLTILSNTFASSPILHASLVSGNIASKPSAADSFRSVAASGHSGTRPDQAHINGDSHTLTAAVSAPPTNGPILAGDTSLLSGTSQSSGSSGNSSTSGTGSGTFLSSPSNSSACVINVTFDASCASAPAGFESDVLQVVQFYESEFTNPVTINIDVGYGEVDGQSLSGSLGSSLYYENAYSYSQVRNALVAGATSSTDTTAVSTLPSSDPTNGGWFYVPTAQAKALGLASGSSIDGYVGFSSSPNIFCYNNSNGVPAGQYDFVGTVAHEISEVMGRMIPGVGAYSVMDLFDYTASGTRDLTGAPPGYFSINGGTTNLGNWNTNASGDYGDWAGSVGNNAFLAFASPGVTMPVTTNDLTLMDAIGWTLTSQSASPAITGIVESPSSGDLNAGHVVTLTLNLSEAVTVAGGTPTLTLNDGGTATYTGGSGSGALTFSYTAAAGQNTAGLAATAVNLNSATITDGSGNAANLSLTGLTQTGPQIDTTAPAVTMALASDTGSSSSDKITSNPALSGTGDANAVVTLTQGATVLGTTTANASGAWSFTPSGLAQGTQTIVASETDAAGNTGTASLTFTLDTVAPATPVIASFSPDSGTVGDGITNATVLTLSGTAEANSTVSVYDGATLLGSATANGSGSWSYATATLANGSHSFTAKAADAAGNVGAASTPLAVTVDTVAPAVTMALASDTGSSSSDKITSNPALSGTGDANAVVTLTQGATVLGTTTANASGAWSFTPSGLAQGAQTIVASETDAAGNTGTASLTFTLDSVAPAVTMALASDTGSSSSDKITSNPALSGTGDANAVVTLTQGATVLGTTTANASGAWSFTPSGLAQGAQTIVASETDAAGNTGTASLTFTLDSVAPAVTVALASDTGSSSSDKITSNPALSGTGDANAVVTLTQGATVLGTTTANASGAWSFTPSGLAQGTQTIVASETDAAGNTGTASLTFTLDTVAPATPVIASFSPDSGTVGDGITNATVLTLSGTAEANSTVSVYDGATLLGSATANGSGSWSYATATLANGSHSFTAKAADAAGNVGAASTPLAVTVDTVAPAVTMALASDTGSSSSDKITSNPALSGTGDANAVVTLTQGATVLGTTTANASGAWSFTPSGLAQGAQTIVASETDAAGNTGTASLTFTLDTRGTGYAGHCLVLTGQRHGGRRHYQCDRAHLERHRGGEQHGQRL